MPGISGVYGMLGSAGETAGAAFKAGRGYLKAGKRMLLGGVGAATRSGTVAGVEGMKFRAQVPVTQGRSAFATGFKQAKAALSGRPGTLLHGVTIGGKQVGVSGRQLGMAKRLGGAAAAVGVPSYAIGKHREKRSMMRGIR